MIILWTRSSGYGREKEKAATVKPQRVSQAAVQELRGEVRKAEARVAKIEDMREKLAKKLADPAMYEDTRRGEAEVWQKKSAEVMEALDRAEAIWMAAAEKLEKATSNA